MVHAVMGIPKVSTVHQGFAGTLTHMDGNDEEEKKSNKHWWSTFNKELKQDNLLKVTVRINNTFYIQYIFVILDG